MAQCGRFTISIDVELAWGSCDRPLQPGDYATIGHEREVVQRLLDLFEAYNVRATWAIVGHLLLRESPWDGETAHPDFPRPVVRNEVQDWFCQLPKTPNDPTWYGPDLVD